MEEMMIKVREEKYRCKVLEEAKQDGFQGAEERLEFGKLHELALL